MAVGHVGTADYHYLFKKRWNPKFHAHTSVCTTSCVNEELESELQYSDPDLVFICKLE
jgi:hypothetical protein